MYITVKKKKKYRIISEKNSTTLGYPVQVSASKNISFIHTKGFPCSSGYPVQGFPGASTVDVTHIPYNNLTCLNENDFRYNYVG